MSKEMFIKGTVIFFMDFIIHTTVDSELCTFTGIVPHRCKVLMEMSCDSSTLVTIKGSTV